MALRLLDASIKQLNVFRSVVENSGFAAAQAELNTSAASISIQMKELEEQLGMTLCERGRTGFKLTERGRAVYEATRGLIASFDNFNLEVANIREELVGEIRIGLQDNVSTNSRFKLPTALANFNQRPNQVTFRIEEATSSEQESRTLEGRYQFAIGIFYQRIASLHYRKLFEEEVSLFCAKGHPLFDKPDSEISLEVLQQARFASTEFMQSEIKRSQFLSRTPDAFAENIDALCLLILSGHYISFMPNHFAQTWVDRGQMRALLPEKTAGLVPFYMITRQGVQQPLAVETFIQEIIDCHQP